jgi:hypothetical protein
MNTFQSAVLGWMENVIPGWASRKNERLFRFSEESLELLQSLGMTKDEVLRMVDYVYARPIGEPNQELGGAMLTLAALSTAHAMDMYVAGYQELDRVCRPEIIEKIKNKHRLRGNDGPPRGNDAL